MRVPFLLATCSTVAVFFSDEQTTSPKHLVSDTSSVADTPGSAASSLTTSDAASYCVSLQSNFSLQTLPSVPSLQRLTSETLNVFTSFICTNSPQPRPQLPVTCLAVHGNLLCAASSHEINVDDRSSCTHLHAFNDDDSSYGFVKSDSRICIWKLSPSKEYKLVTVLPTLNDRLRRFIFPKNYVKIRLTGLAVNNGLIYSVSWDSYLKIRRASDLRCLESIKAHEDAVNAVTEPFTPGQGIKRHVLIATLEKHKSAVNALALNDDGSVLFSGACDRSILVWEREDSTNHMAVTEALRGHGKAILSLVNVSDLLLSGSANRTVRIWQRCPDEKYCCLAVLEGHNKPVKSLAAAWEGETDGVVSVYSGSLDGEIKAWQVLISRSARLNNKN
ncbi:hypothetical protein P3X46_017632 [Hevea brasiliensis]|uniref:Anaphase-promoting complex subunit 4 WD40 domain-containing protein n=1 Tax=Hevea brasiliensis TaxID=3981 RepID=A0ABQ9LN79_HEVBR|nr:hypothetical protein P3X46_017632 [Hevea brasiliensis]